MKISQNPEKTRSIYDSLSCWYDILSSPAENLARRQAETLLEIQAGDRILEIGCGTGTASIEMGKKVGAFGFVYALDLSQKMLKVAQRKLKKHKHKIGVELICGDAGALPFSTGCMTGILISFTLELFSDREIQIVLQECKRVLGSASRLSVVSVSKSRPRAYMLKLYSWLHEHFPAWFDCRPILLGQTLEANGFDVIYARQSNVLGLPIEIVLVKP